MYNDALLSHEPRQTTVYTRVAVQDSYSSCLRRLKTGSFWCQISTVRAPPRPSARSRDKIRLVPNITRAMFSTVNMISTIESRRPADLCRSREFAPRAASGPRRRGTGGGGHRAKRRVLAWSCLGIVATVMHDVYDALTAALSSFMDRRPRFCRRVTGRLVGAHPRALGGAGGRARRRVVVLSARLYILYIHTRPTVAW